MLPSSLVSIIPPFEAMNSHHNKRDPISDQASAFACMALQAYAYASSDGLLRRLCTSQTGEAVNI